ncbi:TIGR00725 family protein [Helicobacter didelphidarum]|uniref:TIGR00725 family protein n=1 Tax=Helicobacter didelphidarum TaxID=2040648 RepID=A0A3D8IM88_9HELI|nr:TIGR00725 family protein [Helicobacter didelphidarum]RDU66349.1 TIGR00725 family protein [Helicobacter didelphidarum]
MGGGGEQDWRPKDEDLSRNSSHTTRKSSKNKPAFEGGAEKDNLQDTIYSHLTSNLSSISHSNISNTHEDDIKILLHKKIAVIGYANLDSLENNISQLAQNLTYNLGRELMNEGCIIINGGLGGVMEVVSKGAREAKSYTAQSIIGVLPNYDSNIANPYIDTTLPTGFDVGRNIVLVSMADAVVVIGGGAGTLNEISLAWQLNKPIITLGDFGWGGKLANTALDNRRNDIIYKAQTPIEVIEILKKELLKTRKIFNGIDSIISYSEAKNKISKYYNISLNDIEILGEGTEGIILRDKNYTYKLFKEKSSLWKKTLYFQLSTIAYKLKNHHNILYPNFEINYKDNDLIISYPYKESYTFSEYPCISKEILQEFLSQCYYVGITHLDIQPKNLRICKETHTLFICDIGYDLHHFTDNFFESMCRRFFALYLLKDYLNEISNIKYFLTPLNTNQDFKRIEDFYNSKNLNYQDLDMEYKNFRNNIGEFILYRNLIIDLYSTQESIKTIFDYGSGHGNIASMLSNKLHKEVSTYEIDKELLYKYKKYYQQLKAHYWEDCEIERLIRENQKFDSVLCSLVLCHALADNEKDRLKIINQIMCNICALSKKHIFIVICNPIYNQSISNIQKREEIKIYSQATEFTKQMLPSGNARADIHRPISYYENLFKQYKLTIRQVIQSGDFRSNHFRIINSDFILFDLVKE